MQECDGTQFCSSTGTLFGKKNSGTNFPVLVVVPGNSPLPVANFSGPDTDTFSGPNFTGANSGTFFSTTFSGTT